MSTLAHPSRIRLTREGPGYCATCILAHRPVEGWGSTPGSALAELLSEVATIRALAALTLEGGR